MLKLFIIIILLIYNCYETQANTKYIYIKIPNKSSNKINLNHIKKKYNIKNDNIVMDKNKIIIKIKQKYEKEIFKKIKKLKKLNSYKFRTNIIITNKNSINKNNIKPSSEKNITVVKKSSEILLKQKIKELEEREARAKKEAIEKAKREAEIKRLLEEKAKKEAEKELKRKKEKKNTEYSKFDFCKGTKKIKIYYIQKTIRKENSRNDLTEIEKFKKNYINFVIKNKKIQRNLYKTYKIVYNKRNKTKNNLKRNAMCRKELEKIKEKEILKKFIKNCIFYQKEIL